MNWVARHVWVVALLPLLSAGAGAVLSKRQRKLAAGLAIGSMAAALLLSLVAFAQAVLAAGPGQGRVVSTFKWFELGNGWMTLGWVLDPLGAVMLVMVSLVGLLIFIYSTAYMAEDANYARFFCFLSLFAAAMLGLVISNSLLLFFICWELVGLTSYLLIGFWFHKPSAAAAAKKAFITTRIGDLAFLLGMVWWYGQSGTLLFYADGAGCLEPASVSQLAMRITASGLTVSGGITLLLFCGAVGKSGQVPLHVWLPDAMEGPTPVSALIHAATMVAAGVFLMARVYPLAEAGGGALPLGVVTWVGAFTAVFAASIAVAQNDIKRILAYSTVSQLGYMMMGLGAGGVAVGMFHLITHAFFKALLFLGAGSVIHGCHEEQDIRRMGGLRKLMPVTFATYAVGMLALCGFPLLFSGFWSKEAVLHAAHGWGPSQGPFYLGVIGALLTAFYMTRQACYVFLGEARSRAGGTHHGTPGPASSPAGSARENAPPAVHESPLAMTVPLMILAAASVGLGFIGTPAWEWFQGFLNRTSVQFKPEALLGGELVRLILLSSLVVMFGIGLGYWLYGRKRDSEGKDALERLKPDVFWLLQNRYFVDEIYAWSVVRLNARFAALCDWLDRWVWESVVQACALSVLGLSWVNRFFEQYVVNGGFNEGCRRLRDGGLALSRSQDGRVQWYLRIAGLALLGLILCLVLGVWRP